MSKALLQLIQHNENVKNIYAVSKSKMPAEITRKLGKESREISAQLEKLPVSKREAIFCEVIKIKQDGKILDKGSAGYILDKYHENLSSHSIQLAFNNILPSYDIRKLVKKSVIDNMMLHKMLSIKAVSRKLSEIQIKRTFETSVLCFDEGVAYAIEILKCDFDRVMQLCPLFDILNKLEEQLQDIKSDSDKEFVKQLINVILDKFKENFEKYEKPLILQMQKNITYSINNSFARKKLFPRYLKNTLKYEYANLTDKQLQNAFNLTMGFLNYTLPNNKEIQNTKRTIVTDFEEAIYIFQIANNRLTNEQIQKAFEKSSELNRLKEMRLPSLAECILTKYFEILSPISLETAFKNSIQISFNNKLANDKLAIEILTLIKRTSVEFLKYMKVISNLNNYIINSLNQSFNEYHYQFYLEIYNIMITRIPSEKFPKIFYV